MLPVRKTQLFPFNQSGIFKVASLCIKQVSSPHLPGLGGQFPKDLPRCSRPWSLWSEAKSLEA